jgi:putative ABC transport system permease protein
VDVYEDRPKLGSALEKAERYLGLSSIVVILISGVAIAMAKAVRQIQITRQCP